MKRVLLSLSFIFLVFALDAQSSRASRFSFGASLEAGYSGDKDSREEQFFGTFGPSSFTLELNRAPGFAGGLWMAYQLGRRWDVELGVNLGAWRAFAQTESESFGPGEILTAYSNDHFLLQQELLRIPLQMRFYLGQPEHRIRPFIAFGMQTTYITKQTNRVRFYTGGTGQATREASFATNVNLRGSWVDVQRWQLSLIGGIGFQLDRASLSIQRNWPFSEATFEHSEIVRYFPDFCSGDSGGDINSHCDYRVRQLLQTSLRFTYRLF